MAASFQFIGERPDRLIELRERRVIARLTAIRFHLLQSFIKPGFQFRRANSLATRLYLFNIHPVALRPVCSRSYMITSCTLIGILPFFCLEQ